MIIDSGWFITEEGSPIDVLRESIWKPVIKESRPDGWVRITLYLRIVRETVDRKFIFESRIRSAEYPLSATTYGSSQTFWAEPVTLIPFVEGGVF